MELITTGNQPPLSPDTVLYRYLSAHDFENYFLNDCGISFTRITRWDDRQEGLRFCAMKEKMPDHPYATRPLDEFFASCWTLQTEDRRLFESDDDYQKSVDELAKDGSDAMWRAYCPDGGVRIKTTLGKLEELILSSELLPPDIHAGPVHYDPYASNWGQTLKSDYFASAFLHKRVSFRHESEFRFVFCVATETSDDRIDLPVTSSYDLIDEILVSPATKRDGEIKRSHDLVRLSYGIFPENNLAARGNTKNEKPFCRISQLYGIVPFSH